ncbi:DUF3291 domain-containing protein [Streptomyces sp. NPDC004012]
MTHTDRPRSRLELAQVGVARLLAPLDSPQLKDFVDALAPVKERLLHLRAHGPTECAFTLRTSSRPGEAAPAACPVGVVDDDLGRPG